MKGTVGAIVILLLLIIAICLNAYALDYNINAIYKSVTEAAATPDSKYQFERIFDDFLTREKFICLTVSHSDLSEIESAFAELIGAAEAKDEESVIIAKSRLTNALMHLRRLSIIGIEGIL